MYIYVCIVLAFNPNRAKQQIGTWKHHPSFQRYFIKAGNQAGRHELLVSCPWAASKKPGSTTAAHGYPAYMVGPRGQNGWQMQNAMKALDRILLFRPLFITSRYDPSGPAGLRCCLLHFRPPGRIAAAFG